MTQRTKEIIKLIVGGMTISMASATFGISIIQGYVEFVFPSALMAFIGFYGILQKGER